MKKRKKKETPKNEKVESTETGDQPQEKNSHSQDLSEKKIDENIETNGNITLPKSNGKDPELSEKEKLERLTSQLQESNDRTLRLRAEFDNFRKRSQRDLADARSFAKMAAIEEILPVMDNFKMALSASDTSDNFDTLKEGMNLILVEFERCFKNLGVEEVPTAGQSFDPNLHEAVSTESSTEIEEGHIIKEWKSGYRLGEKLLRPASVVVSSGPDSNAK